MVIFFYKNLGGDLSIVPVIWNKIIYFHINIYIFMSVLGTILYNYKIHAKYISDVTICFLIFYSQLMTFMNEIQI